MSIKKLDPEVVSKIRSSFTVNSVAQCVFELVANSLDAKSTSIAIRINMLTFKIQVADNGEGITKENMHLLGLRNTTNKCQKYKDLEHLKTYGYRGEALASIMEMCQKITITSRCKKSNDTYITDLSKVSKGKVKLGKYRASIGTTVTVFGWFSTVPVRQQRIVEEIELEEVKNQLEALIIINPQTSFSLRNDVTGLLILNIPKTPDIVDTFRHLHPEFSEAFTLLKVTKNKVSVRLLIQKELFPTKKFQYIYVNKRPVKSSKIKQHIYKTSGSSNQHKTKQSLLFSNKKHPVYVMNIKCPQKCLDLGSKELELTCWDLVLACIDKLIKIFFGFEEKDKPLVRANKEVKLNCGLSRIFGVVEATAYKRKSQEIELPKEDTSKRMRLGMFKPVEDRVATKTSDENWLIEDCSQNENYKNAKSKSPIVNEEHFDQKSTYSKLNIDESLGKKLILDMFLKSTQVYSTEDDISASGETIQESNMVFENQIKDRIKGTNTTMSVSINVKKKRLDNKKKRVQTNRKLSNRKKSILTSDDDDFGHNVTSKGVQTSIGLLYEGRQAIDELTDSFQEFSLDHNNKNDEYTVKKKADIFDDNEDFRFMPLKFVPGEHEKFFKFDNPLQIQQISGNYLQSMQFEPEDNYDEYKKQFKLQLKNARAEEDYLPFRAAQFEQTDDNYEKFKMPLKPPPRHKPIINSRAKEGYNLPHLQQEEDRNYNFKKPFERPLLRAKPMLSSRAEEGSYFPFRGMQLQQEEDNYEKFKKPSVRYKPTINSRAQENTYLPIHGMQFRQKEDNNAKVQKHFEPPLRSKPILSSNSEEDSNLPFRNMQFQQEEVRKFKKPVQPPLRSKPILSSNSEEDSHLPFRNMQFQQEEVRQFKKPYEPPLRSKPILSSNSEEDSNLPFRNMQYQQEEVRKLKKPCEHPLRSKPILSSNSEEDCNLPYRNMQFQQEEVRKFKKPFEHPLRSKPILSSNSEEDSNLPFRNMQFQQEVRKFKKPYEPPLRSKPILNNRAEDGRYLPFESVQFQQKENDYEKFKKRSEAPQISRPVVNRHNEGNYCAFRGMQFEQEDDYEKFKNPPQISKPMVNRINEGNVFACQGTMKQKKSNYEAFKKPLELSLYEQGNQVNYCPEIRQFEQQENNYETFAPPLRNRKEIRYNEGNNLPSSDMQQFAQDQYEKCRNPPLRLRTRRDNGDCLASRGRMPAPEQDCITNIKNPPMEIEDNYFPFRSRHQFTEREDTNEKFKHPSEIPLISKPMMSRANEGNYLQIQEMQQFEQDDETYQNSMEPPLRSNPLENRVNNVDNYLAFPGRSRFEQEDGRFKQTSEPSLWSKPAVKEKRANNYRHFPSMHQIEQGHLKNPVERMQSNYLHFRGMQVEPENIAEKFKKPSEPPPRVNRINERNYLPYREMHQFEQDNYEKFRNPAATAIKTGRLKEGYYFPTRNIQFEQRNNNYENFQNPQDPPPMMTKQTRIEESNYLPLREMHQYEQQQNYNKHFKKLEPPPIKNLANEVPFPNTRQAERFNKPSESTIGPKQMSNECNCSPIRGMQSEQENDDYENFEKMSEPPFLSKPMVKSGKNADDYLPFQGIQLEEDYCYEKPSELPLISKPITKNVKENNHLSFRGIKKLPFQQPNQNGNICSQSPYFSKKPIGFNDFEPKFMSTQNNCIKSPTNSMIFNKKPHTSNKFHHFQPEPLRNDKNGRFPHEPEKPENDNPNQYSEENRNQIMETPPEIVPDDALEEPPWLTPNISNDDCYIERSPKNFFNFNDSPNIFSSEANTQKEFKSLNANFNKELSPKKSDKMFDFKSNTQNIFSSEPQTEKDLKSFCNLQDFGLTGSKNIISSNLEISIPNKDGQMEIIQKDLCDLRENNFELGSTESDIVIQETEKSIEKSRVIVSSQNEWLRRVNDNGQKFFFNKRTGMVTVQTPKISQTKFDFDERLDFVPKGLSPALKGHEKVEKLLSQKAKNKLHDLILEGYEDELMVIKWQKFIGNSPKTFFENIYKEKTKQFETNIPSVHENALKIPKDFVNFNNKMFKSLTVLGQLDKKFIVVHERTKDLLILFDQHAAHERIRVERFTKEYKGIKTSYKGQCTIFLQHNDLSLLKTNVDYLESLGLGVDFMSNGLQITDIPLCIQEKVNNGDEDLNKILNVLVKDTVEFLKVSRGSAGTMMPKILQNIINLRACRGAIKFGNSLTEPKCVGLLKELSKCMLPFQCAHGRPTLSPIVSLRKINVRIQDNKPNLKKLLMN